MSTTTQQPDALPRRRRRTVVRRVLAAVLLLGWVGVMWALVLTGTRTATWDELSTALDSGEVDHATVVGSVLSGEGVSGYSVVEVRWRDGLVQRRTDVAQVVGPQEERPPRGVHVVKGSVTRALHDIDAGVEIDVEPLRGGAFTQVLGLRLEGAAATAFFLLGLSTLMLLVGGPEPERATRWAWFWLMAAAAPIACPAYLLLGGMLRERPQPAPRRFTGGWAFVVFLVLGGANAAGR